MTTPNLVRAKISRPDSAIHDAPRSQHRFGASVALHLLPGLAMVLAYVFSAPLVHRWGLPIAFTGSLSILFVLVPLELGIVLYHSRRHGGRWSFASAMSYREPMPRWQYLVLVPLLVVVYTMVIQAWQPVELALAEALWWVPAWIVNPLPQDGVQTYAAPVLLMTAVMRVLCTGLVAPIVEEIYFRGYLLPHIDRLGVGAPVLNAVLFACYHLWTVLLNPGRALAWLPIVYLVWRKRNIALGITVHILLNLIGVIGPLGVLMTGG
jgi:uncharacterized protein